MQKTIIITGALGFISSYLVDYYVAKGWEVIGIDNCSRSTTQNHNPKATYSLRNINEITINKADVIIHGASYTSVGESLENPDLYKKNNYRDFIEFIEKTPKNAKQVFISSGGAIYGECKEAKTETAFTDVQSPYGKLKLMAEQYLRLFDNTPLIIRPSNVYGFRQRLDNEGGVIAIYSFLRKIGVRQAPVYGDGKQVRDFVHVTDLVDSITKLIDKDSKGIFNVASGNVIDVNQVADWFGLARMYRPAKEEIRQSIISNKKLVKEIGKDSWLGLEEYIHNLKKG